MEVVKQMQEMGYVFTVLGGRLKYHYAGPGEPDIRASELLMELRANKEEVLNYIAAIPPPAPLECDNDTAEIINKVYQGTFSGSALVPVLPEYRDIFGYSVWICANEQAATKKRIDSTISDLVFTVTEFKAMVETAMKGLDELRSVINVKRTFGGVIGVA